MATPLGTSVTSSSTVNEDDQSRWMIEWNMWRKGTLDDKSPSVTSSTTLDRSSASPCQPLPVASIGNSPSTARAADIDAAPVVVVNDNGGNRSSGSKLDVWRNLTRGLGKTLNEAEQNLGSVLSQAAVRLLNRRTSSADEVINMQQQQATENSTIGSFGGGGGGGGDAMFAAAGAQPAASVTRSPYGIPAKCADSFTRTNFRTASRRRRDFRSRRLNQDDDDDVAGACYRDSV